MRSPGPNPESAASGSHDVSKARADSPAEAEGRRILSTAFVRLGAGETLAVELREGRTIVLRDVAMRPRDFCGVQVLGSSAGSRYCGGYAEVVAARTGAAPAAE